MNWSFQKIGEVTLQVLSVGVILVFIVMWARRLRDPKAVAVRLAISLPLLAIVYFKILPLFQHGLSQVMIAGLFFLVAIGWLLAGLWVPAVTGFIGNLFGNLYDGGNQEIEAKPFFSVFNAKRLKGKYFEALAEIRAQLAKFPTNFEAQMLLAELQAENLNDLPGADVTVERICNQPEHTPLNIAFALNRLADWHLGITKDRETARQKLEKIQQLYPNSELALNAAQKIAHLADSDMLLASHDRQKLEVKKGVKYLGLHRGEDGRLKAPEVDQEKIAAEYVAHLEQHPLDTHAREKLAVLYAEHYHRLDLAVDQLEQMIQQPSAVARQVVGWLNIMADLQVKEGAGEEAVRATLQRIVDGYPSVAAAETARRRIDHLKLEMKRTTTRAGVQLGTYEQNLGLKRGAGGAK
ncbi:MAG TPA: tetratricopeptide repeat protein [Verrucomicrobiae bacterium]|jgi:tetratricopeptide (TPR) repeat protein|nr:tetratricopeptide repeat protein [Verrucomicrobiae bacterium]